VSDYILIGLAGQLFWLFAGTLLLVFYNMVKWIVQNKRR
jgi:hypothetical protein